MPLWVVLTQAAREATTCLVASKMRASNSSLATLPPSVVCIVQSRSELNFSLLRDFIFIIRLHWPEQAMEVSS